MISGKTSLIGLLGDPVSHSLSPIIHNAALKEMGIDWCYLALPCISQNLDFVLTVLPKINCKGLNITIPHKETVAKACDELTEIALKLGAVNTLIPNKKGGWIGTNTDVNGFKAPLAKINWEDKKAIVIGCGGSAKAVIAGLYDLNVNHITVIARNYDSLKNCLSKIQEKFFTNKSETTNLNGLLTNNPEIKEHIKKADLIVNTTPVGMSSYSKSTSIAENIPLGEEIWQNLQSKTIIYDLIYTPRPTKWLKIAEDYGCETIDGLEMLIQQGASSLKLWTNKNEIPIKLMRKAAIEHLSI